MTDAMVLTGLLAEAETTFSRETEAILAGQPPDAAVMARKAELVDRLLTLMPAAAHLAADVTVEERQQMRLGLERMLSAAARNETVLQGALRGSRILIAAAAAAGQPYPGAQPEASPRPRDDGFAGQVDRLA